MSYDEKASSPRDKKYYYKREPREQKNYDYYEESSHPILLEVRLEDCSNQEQMIRRFLKKFKKFKLMDEIKEHDHYTKPSDKKRLKQIELNLKHRKKQLEFEEKMKDK